jgi:fluoroquinolone transport system ATP-binding protein
MIDVENLTFTYVGTDKPAIADLNFSIQPGEIFGLLGPSGAGKSTTQKILIGLLRGFKGKVSIGGRALQSLGHAYYERIGVSFEQPYHYSKLTGLENLKYFGSLYQGQTVEPATLLEWVGLEDDGAMLVSQYSKGMKNRLSVARSLLNNGEILFLDEPTAGLDPVNALRIKDLIQTQQQAGRTILLTTHDMNVADALCDRVAFIVDGAIKLIDDPAELKLRYGRQDVRVEYRADGALEHRDFPLQGLADNAEFHALLRDTEVRTVHSQEATLDTIFIQVTGRSLQ